MIIILKCFPPFLNVLVTCGFATSVVVCLRLPTMCFSSLPHHCTTTAVSSRATAATTMLPTVGSRINANLPKGRSQIRLQRDVASQQSKGERSNFRLVLAFLPVTHVVRRGLARTNWIKRRTCITNITTAFTLIGTMHYSRRTPPAMALCFEG